MNLVTKINAKSEKPQKSIPNQQGHKKSTPNHKNHQKHRNPFRITQFARILKSTPNHKNHKNPNKNHYSFLFYNPFHENTKMAITQATRRLRSCRFVIMMASCATHRLNMVAMMKNHLKTEKSRKKVVKDFKRPQLEPQGTPEVLVHIIRQQIPLRVV